MLQFVKRGFQKSEGDCVGISVRNPPNKKSDFLKQQGQYRKLHEINTEEEAYDGEVKFTATSQNPGECPDYWKGSSEGRPCHLAKQILPLIKEKT